MAIAGSRRSGPPCGGDSPGIEHVVAEIWTVVDAADHHVRLVLEGDP
jgi:hypothetical protein